MADLNTAGAGSDPAELTVVGDTLYFVATDRTVGREVWKSDGTPGRTAPVADLAPELGSLFPTGLTAVGSDLYFFTTDYSLNVSGATALWKTDGTAAATVRVKVLPATVETSASSIRLVPVNNGAGVCFATDDRPPPGGSRSAGVALWFSDGTEAGTNIIRYLPQPADPNKFASIGFLTAVGPTVFFRGSDPDHGIELWKTDGTTAGTVLVKDIYPGLFGSTPISLAAGSGRLYFVANSGGADSELWESDGTEAGTVRVKDINPGGGSSSPDNLAAAGELLYFSATDGTPGTSRVWKTDGTNAGTVRIDPPVGGAPAQPDKFTAVADGGGTVFFRNRADQSLWKTDGTNAGTVRLLATAAGGRIDELAAVGGRLFFTCDDARGAGYEMWTSDGTAAGTRPVVDLLPGRDSGLGAAPYGPRKLAAYGGRLIFVGNDGDSGVELFAADSTTPTGVTQVLDLVPGNGNGSGGGLVWFHGGFFFNGGGAPSDATYAELWRTDGTPTGTAPVADINPAAPYSDPRYLTVVGDTLFFSAQDGVHGRELWKSDGTGAGTALVKDLWPGSVSSGDPTSLIAMDGLLYFVAGDPVSRRRMLWHSDGTAEGTSPVAAVGTDRLTLWRGALYFAGVDANGRSGLWTTDGTAAGTVPLVSLDPGSIDTGERGFVSYGDKLYFAAYNASVYIAEDRIALWQTDGTAAGTRLVVKGFGAIPRQLTTAGATLFFTTDDSRGQTSLWASDGTESGTVRLRQFTAPGNWSSQVMNLWAVNGAVLFEVRNDAGHIDLWRSDGTAAGTTRVAEVFAQPDRSSGEPTVVPGLEQDLLFFPGDDGDHGTELWMSDGTPDGTRMVEDLYPGPGHITPVRLTSVGGALWYTADDAVHGSELRRIAPPAADPGGPYRVPFGGSAILDASASTDPDPGEALTFTWDLDGDGLFGETGAAAGRGDEIGARPTFVPTGLAVGDTVQAAVRVRNGLGLVAQATAPITVAPPGPEVLLAGSSWRPAFVNALRRSGLGDGGVRVGTADSLTLPWVNLDQVKVRYDRDPGADPGPASLDLTGAAPAGYAVRSYAYDPTSRTATWTFAAPFRADRLTIRLGDGTACTVNVLPGDAYDRGGAVNAFDYLAVRIALGRTAATAPAGAYPVYLDVDGSARIDVLDLAAVKTRLGKRLDVAASVTTSLSLRDGVRAAAALVDEVLV